MKKNLSNENHHTYTKFIHGKGSVTTPIRDTSLSASISIIDIDRIQKSVDNGCQGNKNQLRQENRKNLMIYSGENYAGRSVIPTNKILSKPRRVQVEENSDIFIKSRKPKINFFKPSSKVQFYKKNSKTYVTYSTNRDMNSRIMQKKLSTPEISYPDVNIQVISMMLPTLNESLIQNRMSSNGRNDLISVAENKKDYKKERVEEIAIKETTDLDSEITKKMSQSYYPLKEIEVLWKHSLKNEEKSICCKPNDDSASALTNDPRCIKIEKFLINQSAEKEYENYSNKRIFKPQQNKNRYKTVCDKKLEQIYHNEKLHRSSGPFEGTNQQSSFICMSETKEKEFSGTISKENIVEEDDSRKNSTFVNQHNGGNQMEFPNEIFSDEIFDSHKKECVTLFSNEQPLTSSTDFVSYIPNEKVGSPDLMLQNPYCRNYFVYAASLTIPMSDMRIARKIHDYLNYTKQKKFLNTQYSCMKDIENFLIFLIKNLKNN